MLAEETEASSSVGAAESQPLKVSAKRQNINVVFGTFFSFKAVLSNGRFFFRLNCLIMPHSKDSI